VELKGQRSGGRDAGGAILKCAGRWEKKKRGGSRSLEKGKGAVISKMACHAFYGQCQFKRKRKRRKRYKRKGDAMPNVINAPIRTLEKNPFSAREESPEKEWPPKKGRPKVA